LEAKVRTRGRRAKVTSQPVPVRPDNTRRRAWRQRRDQAYEVPAEDIRGSEALQSAVFSALAHDARGPLNSIKIAASTLLGKALGNPEQEHELIMIILDEVNRMNQWLDEACKVGQIEPARFTPRKAPCDLGDLVSSVCDEFGLRLASRAINLEISDSLPMAECDGEMIRRVLKLLLDNANKYSPFGMPISISIRRIERQMLVIAVGDGGPGVPDAERARIFEKHYRGVYQNSDVPGTGLGLASARTMVRSQGGEIWVTNRPEGGAAFHFSLPAAMQSTRATKCTARFAA
jgi:K+-sensing histidine kinase KdpD